MLTQARVARQLLTDIRSTFLEPPHTAREGTLAVARLLLWHIIIKRVRRHFIGRFAGLLFFYDSPLDGCAYAYIMGRVNLVLEMLLDHVLGPGDMYMDIGANVGTDCLLALKRGAFVHAFEPSEPIFNVLAINVYLNGFSRRARLNTVVVADRTGVVDFFESPVGASGLSSLRATESLQQRRTQMTSTTLDDYVEQNDIQHVKLLKIDIEGGELVVFQGARDVLENGVVDVIQWESNYRASSAERAQTVNLLDAHGYTSFGFDARRRLVPWSGQPECVSVRRDRLQLVSMFHDARV